MNPIFRNILAIIAGFTIGSIVNMLIIMISGLIIPPPAGADVTTVEGLTATMHLFQPRHFIFPFLAHAMGTFTGAFLAAMIAANHKTRFALGVGFFFLIGGITNAFILPAPTWFIVLDLMFAYIPVAYLAGNLQRRRRKISMNREYSKVNTDLFF